MKLVRLTTPNGHIAYVNPEMVCAVEPPVAGVNSAGAMIVLANTSLFVREIVEDVVKALQKE